MKTPKAIGSATALFLVITTLASATPSTQIWNPSTDIQPYQVWHLTLDNYTRLSKTGAITNNVYDTGLTVGVLPFEKIQLETGFDYMETGTGSTADRNPIYFNAKLGLPENSLAPGSPAVAAGGYNFGTKTGVTTQNIAYALLAKTYPLGRFSVGYYRGSRRVLTDEYGAPANDGVILSWDRTMTEISDKLWLAVDYASGKSANGALNIGFAWSFTKNVSMIFAYDRYNNERTGGKGTFTTQLDINVPFGRKDLR
ncbi:MAG: hypothetical protein ACOZE5_14485 [Verrucomicrobiota bacterium]